MSIDDPVIDVMVESPGVDWWSIAATGLATFIGVLAAAALAFRQYRRTRQHESVRSLIESIPNLAAALPAAALADALNANAVPSHKIDEAHTFIKEQAGTLTRDLQSIGQLFIVPESIREAMHEIVVCVAATGLALWLVAPQRMTPGVQAVHDRIDAVVPALSDWVRNDGRMLGLPSKPKIPRWEPDQKRAAFQLIVDVDDAWPDDDSIVETETLKTVKEWLADHPPR